MPTSDALKKPINGAVASALGVLPSETSAAQVGNGNPASVLHFFGAALQAQEQGLSLPDGTSAGRISKLRLVWIDQRDGRLVGVNLGLQRGSSPQAAAEALRQLAAAIEAMDAGVNAAEPAPAPSLIIQPDKKPGE